MILRRFLASIVLMVWLIGCSVVIFIWSVIEGIRRGLIWTALFNSPLVIMAAWKSTFVALRTGDQDLAMRCYYNEIGKLL